MRALVTGVAGFLGSHVARCLVADGWDVSGIDDLSSGDKERVPSQVHFEIADVRDGIPTADAVFHAAGMARTGESLSRPRSCEVNVTGTLAALESLRGSDTRLVHASSAVVAEPASSPYAASKASAELLVDSYRQAFDLNAVSLRYASVYGPDQSILGDCPNVIAAMRRDRDAYGCVFVTGNGSQTRDFVHVDDAAAFTVAAIRGAYQRPYVDVATGVQTSIREVAERFGCPIRYRPARKGDVRAFFQLATLRDFTPLEVA